MTDPTKGHLKREEFDRGAMDQVKKEIRSALIPFQHKGCTMKTLEETYLEQTGKSIPFKQFGFTDLETFLLSIPDVVAMHYLQKPHNCYFLKAVKQKETGYEPNKNVRKNGYLRRGNGSANTDSYHNQSDNKQKVNLNLPPRLRIKPVPESEQLYIKELISAYPSGLPIGNFERAYKQNFGVAFNPGAYGFLDVKECLGSLSSIVTLVPDKNSFRICAADSSKSVPMPSSTSAPESVAKIEENTELKLPLQRKIKPVPKSEQLSILELMTSYPNGLVMVNFERAYKQYFGVAFNWIGYGFRDLQECLASLPSILKLIPEGNSYRVCVVDATESGACIPSTEENTDANDILKNNLRCVLAQFPNGLELKELLIAYEKIIGKPLNCADYGFRNALDLVGHLTDVFHIQRPSEKGRDFILFDSSKPPSTRADQVQCRPTPQNNSSPEEISPEVKRNVETLLLKHPDGIRLADFDSLYERNCKEEPPWRKLGFKSITLFFLAFDSPVRLLTCKSGNVIVMHESLNGSSVIGGTIPDYLADYVLSGTDYEYLTVTVEMSAEKCIDVYVSQINDPGDFWIQLRGLDTTVEMEKLYDRLQEIYNHNNSELYAIPDHYLKMSMICAVIYPEDQGWHRGKITAFLSRNTVEVFFVDYGTVCQVERGTLRFLRKDFLPLPAQAIKARLTNLKPAAQAWSRDARDLLLDMCRSKPLVAKVTSTTYKNVASVQLIDTNGEDDINLNLELLNRVDLAEYSADDDSETVNSYDGVDSSLMQLQLESAYFYQINNPMNHVPPCSGSYPYHVLPNPEDQQIVSSVLLKMMAMGAAKPVQTPEPVKPESPHSSCSNSPDEFCYSKCDGEERESDVPNLIEVAVDGPEQKQYSQVICLSDSNIHLINYGGKPYVTSGDISALIMWKNDVLKRVLKQVKMNVPSITINKKDCGNLFKELEEKNVAVSEDGASVHLFPFESVKKIIPKFNSQSEDILLQLERVEKNFYPSDPYWIAGLNGDSDDTEMETLVQKRMELLQKMIQSPKGNDACSLEFQKVEEQMKKLEERKNPKKSQFQPSASPKSESKQCTPSSASLVTPDRRVQTVHPTVHQRNESVPPARPQANPVVTYPMSIFPVVPSVNYPPGFVCYPLHNPVTGTGTQMSENVPQQPVFVVPNTSMNVAWPANK